MLANACRETCTNSCMIGLIQRVNSASVEINGTQFSAIKQGILALVCVQQPDTEANADALLKKILNYRIFPDSDNKMNLSLVNTGGELLIVSQFTLAAETAKGLRPGFSKAASPEHGKAIYEYFIEQARQLHQMTKTGVFAADMQVSLVNDGPVTFWLET